MADSTIRNLGECEYTHPRLSGRYRGVSIGHDREGFFAMTHRANQRATQPPKTFLITRSGG